MTVEKICTFEDLAVFQKAYAVSLEIHRMSLKLPRAEQYGLADQMRRASKSICANCRRFRQTEGIWLRIQALPADGSGVGG